MRTALRAVDRSILSVGLHHSGKSGANAVLQAPMMASHMHVTAAEHHTHEHQSATRSINSISQCSRFKSASHCPSLFNSSPPPSSPNNPSPHPPRMHSTISIQRLAPRPKHLAPSSSGAETQSRTRFHWSGRNPQTSPARFYVPQKLQPKTSLVTSTCNVLYIFQFLRC